MGLYEELGNRIKTSSHMEQYMNEEENLFLNIGYSRGVFCGAEIEGIYNGEQIRKDVNEKELEFWLKICGKPQFPENY